MLASIRISVLEVLVVHANAKLAPAGRLKLAECIVEDGWPLRRAAERFQVSVPTAQRWAARYRERDESLPAIEAMQDGSSRPVSSPRQTRPPKVRKIVHLRTTRGWGPARIGHRLRMHPSTVHRVLRREGAALLTEVDLATRKALRGTVKRYEHHAPGDLIHVDVKKLGKIPDGGGHRIHGRQAAQGNSRLRRTLDKSLTGARGYGYVHTALDDHSRLAYSEVLPDETAQTTTAWWRRAIAWFAAQGITIKPSFPTTAAATSRTCGRPPAPTTRSSTAGPGLTGRRPTARSNGSTARSPTNGPTSGPTPQNAPAWWPCASGYTSTTITAPTPPSAASHPRAASPTCRVSTPSLQLPSLVVRRRPGRACLGGRTGPRDREADWSRIRGSGGVHG